MFSNRDDGEIEVIQAIPAADLSADAATAAGIDLQSYRKAYVVVNWGVVTDGTILPSITSSDTLGGSYTADTNVLGTPTAATAATDLTCGVFAIDVKNAKRFIKVALTETVASAGFLVSATVVGVKKSV